MTQRLARGTVPGHEPMDPTGSIAGKKSTCDLSVTCPTCLIAMRPEHAHYKCPQCGYRDSCCF